MMGKPRSLILFLDNFIGTAPSWRANINLQSTMARLFSSSSSVEYFGISISLG